MFSVAGHDIHGISASSSYPVFFFLFYSLAGHGSGTPFLGIVGRKKTIPSHSSPMTGIPFFPLSFGMLRLMSAPRRSTVVRESRPSSRNPTGRGTPLNGVRRRFEACREHDAWHKAMCKRNIANTVVSADHARKEGGKRGCLSNNNIPKKTNYSFGKGLSLFLNRSRHPPCSCSSVDQSRRVLTLWSWVRIPPGARDPYEYVNQFVPSCGSVE